ncbi:MAG: BatD family protein [Verrucomicrobiota bacterium]
MTSSETVVGRPVQLQIKITGASGGKMPDLIAVDGLDIRQTGTSREFHMNGFSTSSSIVYNYTVMPEKAGTFRIPPQTIGVGGASLRTPELALHVSGSSSGSTARPGSGAQPLDQQQVAFAELLVTKKSAYVGEMIPVEIRLGVNARTRANLTKPPEITGQGFTTQKLSEPQQSFETVGGRTYQLLTYKTAIAAARTGQFTVGPVEFEAVVQVPRKTSGSRSPFDLFNMDDPFADPFDPFGALMERRVVKIKSEPAALEVKALPPKAPAEFSGAVGIFNMTTDANPKSAQVGDPLTVTATITGRGNFDRVNAPAISDERGWHKYPPSSKFNQDDDVGMSGNKSFEMVLSPNERKQQVPPLVFSYFDPVKEDYVTLKSDPIAVRIEGGSAAPSPNAAVAAVSSAAPSSSPTPLPKSQDILYQIAEWPRASQSFAPVYENRNFWLIQVVPFLVLVGLMGWKWRSTRRSDRAAQRLARLSHEASELQHSLRQQSTSSPDYFAQAARAVQIKTALAKNVDPDSVDAETAAKAFRLNEPMRERMRDLFQRSDEVRYSGGQDGDGAVSAEQRHEIMELIERLRG